MDVCKKLIRSICQFVLYYNLFTLHKESRNIEYVEVELSPAILLSYSRTVHNQTC